MVPTRSPTRSGFGCGLGLGLKEKTRLVLVIDEGKGGVEPCINNDGLIHEYYGYELYS